MSDATDPVSALSVKTHSHCVWRPTLTQACGCTAAIADRLLEWTRVPRPTTYPPPTAVEWRHYQWTAGSATYMCLHPCSLVFSCNWWNWKRFNSFNWFATYTMRRYTRIFMHRAYRLYTFCMENGRSVSSNWVLVVYNFLQYSFTMSAV